MTDEIPLVKTKTYRVPQNGMSLESYHDMIYAIPMKFDDETDRHLIVANETVTLTGEFLTKEFELVNSVQ